MTNEESPRQMLVPGIEIKDVKRRLEEPRVSKSRTSALYTFLRSEETNTFFPMRRNIEKLFQPVIESFREGEAISIRAITYVYGYPFLDSSRHHEFRYVYTYSLNDLGKYQLCIYIVFYQKRSERDYNYLNRYFHNIKIVEGSVLDGRGQAVPLSYIDTVKVFIVNENPETSRGTETTVQDTTGN
jgi:hypothetical protein